MIKVPLLFFNDIIRSITKRKPMDQKEKDAIAYISEILNRNLNICFDTSQSLLDGYYIKHAIDLKTPIDYNDNIGILSRVIYRVNQIKDEAFSDSNWALPILKPNEEEILSGRLGSFETEYEPFDMKLTIMSRFSNLVYTANKNDVDVEDKVKELRKVLKIFDKLEEIGKLKEDVNEFFMKSRSLYNIMVKNESPDLDEYKREHEKVKEFVNDPERLFNKPQYQSNQAFNEYFEINKTLDKVKNIRDEIYDRISTEAPLSSLTQADDYKNKHLSKNSNNTINEFFINKTNKLLVYENIKYSLESGKNQKYNKFIVFEDNSILIKDNKDNFIVMKDNSQALTFAKEFVKGYLEHKLRKYPKVSKMFSEKVGENRYETEASIITAETFLNNINILKTNNFNILNKQNHTFEMIDDEMNEIIRNHQIKQYAHSISSSKYNNLYNEESYKTFGELYDLNIESTIIQSRIGKKMATYNSPEEFNYALNNLLDSVNNFTLDAILLKAQSNKVKIVSNEDNVLILKIDNFEQSKVIGSTSWCIARDQSYFDSYTRNNNQYFIFDFNKSSKDNNSLIGMTLSSSGENYASHYKDDESMPYSKERKNLQLKIIKADIDNFPCLADEFKKVLNIGVEKENKYNNLSI